MSAKQDLMQKGTPTFDLCVHEVDEAAPILTSVRAELLELPEEDDAIISNLPEDIRRRIISFLRKGGGCYHWIIEKVEESLDYCSPKYRFSDVKLGCRRYGGDFKANRMKFFQIVDKVLDSHNLPVIKRFYLDCVEDSLYDVYGWVSMVILKRVEDLYLLIEPEYGAPLELPTSFFTCETLEVLTLYGPIIVRMVVLCSLPKLKKLDLFSIQYQNDESAHMLISSCQSLEKLHISRDRVDGVENFIIRSSPTLKHLTIYNPLGEESDHSYVINSPGLQQLELRDVPIHGFVIENLSSLVETNISFSDVLDIGLHDDNIHSLFRGISNSKNLEISTRMMQSRIPAHLFPKFDRLCTLEVETNGCNWDSLQEFLMNSDRLEALKFTKCSWSCEKTKHLACWRLNPKTVPICLLSSLKIMTFDGFNGLKDELRMVEYMLKNAKVMQKMEIRYACSLRNTESEPHLRRKILKFSKGSEECQVIIS